MQDVSERYGQWFGDPEVCRDNRHGHKSLSVHELKRYVKDSLKDRGRIVFAIYHKGSMEHIGNISLNSIDRKKRSAEISILIGEKKYWGRGVGLEACRLVSGYALQVLRLDRVWMGMALRNHAMIRIAQKMGMKMDRVVKGGFVKDGATLDLAEYSLSTIAVPKKPRVVLLMKYGNIMGLEYLRAFKRSGIGLAAVLFQGDNFDLRDREIVMERTAGAYKPLFMGDVLNGSRIPFYFVEKHGSLECEQILERLKPDIILLGGAGIIPPSILRKASLGVLNCHPGKLPEYRGCSCVEWAIYNQDPIQATCHTVTAKIDWGAVIYAEDLPFKKKEAYAHLRARMIGHQAKVMTLGIKKFLSARGPWPMMPSEGRYWKPIDPKKLSIVKKRLEMGGYHPAKA